MKNLKYYYLLAITLFSVTAYGQFIQPLKIGDKAPEFLNIKGPMIISFWATWCGPCLQEMKIMDSLIVNYPELKAYPVTNEPEQTVNEFFNKHEGTKPKHLTVITGDSILEKYFPHQALPHNVWIDQNGIIKATTAFTEITGEKIKQFLAGSTADLVIKEDVPFDYNLPLSVPDSLIHFRSIFQPHIKGINLGGFTIDGFGYGIPRKRFYGFNTSRTDLLWKAFTKHVSGALNPKLIEIHTSDSTRFFWPEQIPRAFSRSKYKNREDWMEYNTFFYEIRFPEPVADSIFYSFVTRDLEQNLNVKCHFETKDHLCTVVSMDENMKKKLKATANTGPFRFELVDKKLVMKNVTMSDFFKFINDIGYVYQDSKSQEEPLLNETGFEQTFSADIDVSDIIDDSTRFYNIHLWIDKLKTQFGFRFKNETRPYPVLIIEDLRK